MPAMPVGELIAEWLTLETLEGPMRVYRVRPRRDEAAPPPAAVILLQEAFGVNEHIQDVARRIAAEGYLAVAPDLFHRSNTAEVDYSDLDTAMALIGELGPDEVIPDVRTVFSALVEQEQIPADRIAVVGFCFGGWAAFAAATALPLAASVVFYGPGIVSGTHAVLTRVAGISGPVLMHVGDADPTIPAEDLAAIRAAARETGVDLRLVVHPGTGHGFHCDLRPDVYDADAAGRAWLQTVDFLEHQLGRGQS